MVVRDGNTPDQLFDLATDLGETTDISSQNSSATTDANKEFDHWMSQMATKLAFPGNEGPERIWPERGLP